MRISPASARLSRPFSLLSTALVILLLAAGCGSTRVAYQFRPTTPLTDATAATTDTAQRAAPVVAAVSGVVPQPGTKPARVQMQARQLQQLRRVVAQALVRQRTKATATRTAIQSTQRVARPQQPSEVGLGTTVLGVLGLVVLPISLLGLLIWGGPVWAVLAGLAALAVLIAYLDPFG